MLALIEKGAGSLGFYRVADGQRVAGIDLPVHPHETVTDAAARLACVAQYGVTRWRGPGECGHVVSVIDLAQQRLVRQIDLSPGTGAPGQALSPDGDRLFARLDDDHLAIIDVKRWRMHARHRTQCGTDAAAWLPDPVVSA